MKQFLVLAFISVLLSCSNSDDNSNVNPPTNFFKVNDAVYPLTNAYILAIKYSDGNFAGYNVILTDGEIHTGNDMDGIESLSSSITHVASFILKFDSPLTSIPRGTFNFDSNPSVRDLSSFGIINNIVVEGGEISSSNIISNSSDLVNENARIIITENTANTNINFNLVTTIGQIQGQFTGQIKTNF